ncbi:MAG: fibronectin type III domain-containing protein [Anaerolineaceae bacterium]|nr:fibronectin type III domain-containing protein [Anaerolineaceae bacterium]
MLKIKSLNNLAGISRQPAGGNSAWHNRHRMTGWVGLILVSLLIFSTSPASASDANSNLAGAPTPFNKSDPANNATDQPLNLTLDWNNSQFATSYDYCIDATIDSGCTSPATWTSSGMNSYVDLTSLSGSTTYEWQVRANNIDGTTYANSGNWWTFTTTVAPPGTFSKSSPANNATGQAINSLTLSWGASRGATSYEYCYDSTLDNDCTGWTTNPDTDVVINGLSYATQYEWQVRAVNSNPVKTYADSDTWWYFTTSNAPPGSFSKSSPADDATGQPLSLTLTWGSSSGASSYEYCYDTTVDDTCAGSWTSTELLYANISVGTYDDMFEWQVRAVNGSGTTDADGGSWWQFTTMADPGGFLKSSPGDGSLGQSPSATISWAAYGGATSYDYCYDTDIDGDCDGTWTTNGTATSKELTLDYDNEYEWQVRVWPGEVYADGGSWWTFTTYEAQPGSFSKTDPDNGELNQALSLTLTWAESTDATSYRYCIDSNLEAGHVGVCDASWIPVANNSAEISGLSYNDTYEWQVRAYNDNPNYTNADSGAWHQFTTVVPPPGSFLKISPLDDAVNRSINLTLDWGTSSSATEYEYCIDVTIDQECTSPSEWTSVGTNTEVTLYGLSYDTEYEWQARALNANPIATEADSDIWWTFITMPEAPGAFLKTSPVDTVEGVDPTTSITLEWEESDRAETYWYCIDSLTTPPNDQTCNGIWTLTDSSTSTDISDLLYGTQYEWQIRAENANPLKTEADGGDYHLFTTIVMPPGDFNKSGPTAGAPDQPINLTLDWGDSNAATDYQYCIDAETVPDGTCESGWQSIGGTTSQIALTNLSYATLYEWQVRADNDYPGETYADSGTWWTFTTVVAPPGAFNKTSPAHDSKDLAPSLIPLQWGASTGADSYSYCIDSTINSACNGSWTSTGSNTSVDLPPLDFNTQYEW